MKTVACEKFADIIHDPEDRIHVAQECNLQAQVEVTGHQLLTASHNIALGSAVPPSLSSVAPPDLSRAAPLALSKATQQRSPTRS